MDPIPQELNEIDWKSDLSDNTDRLAQHLCAFANHQEGGYLAYGINNDGSPAPLEKNAIDVIVQKLGNIARNNLSTALSIDHTVIEFRGNPVLIIYIHEVNDKPVHLRGKDLHYSYKRSAGQTVKLSAQEIKFLISISSGIDFESQITAFNISSDDVVKLLDYDSYFRMLELRLPDTKVNILLALASEGLIVKSNEFWNVTNLGAILFTRDIDSFIDLKRKTIRVIVYKETSRINALKEQVGKRGYASGFEGLVVYIMDQLSSNEVIENALRKQVKVYPEVAIREFVANALIHQDFSETGTGVLIEIFTDRIEITNPGVPLVETNRFIDTAPKSRNEKLASLMRRLKICEERGSGIDRAIHAIETYQLPAPKFIKGDNYTRVIMYAPIPLSRMTLEDRVRACYQHTALNYISNQPVNNQSVRKRFNISKNNVSSASKIIADTIESGLIKSSDPENSSKKFASYVPYWA
ncbi:MAG: ATP-binding protein [Bacteroidota bacterium]|nr:ATP-binding protein [Bacteroidota bacterium]